MKKPNVVYVFADQWRAQALGYNGDPNAETPHIDSLAEESVNFTMAVVGAPVCCPYRASLLTGQYPLTHGVFLNDVTLSDEAVSIAQAFRAGGYQTAYIGKWHLDGQGRSSFIPRERRQGFEHWRVLECTHNYNKSFYYGDTDEKRTWEGYDVFAQSREAERYIREYDSEKPFALFLSWGPPHNPYETAPEEYRAMHDPEALELRPNVPPELERQARRDLAGYYAHISAMDAEIDSLVGTLKELGLDKETIFVFTSDHGDMLGSQGEQRKQRPWDESIRVPFLLRYPDLFGAKGRQVDIPFNTPDIMPTLLDLCGVDIPDTVEGVSYAGYLRGESELDIDAALIACQAPFGEWSRAKGGKEYRGIRTRRHTYVRDLDGPWLLYDNEADPHQLNNLCGQESAGELQASLDRKLSAMLEARGDEFLPADDYIALWKYPVNESGTVPYTN